MTKQEILTLAKQKGATLEPNKQMLVTPEHNYWIFNYGDGLVYIGYFYLNPESKILSGTEYVMMAHGKDVAKVQKLMRIQLQTPFK